MLPLGKLGYGVAQIGNLYREGTDENALEAVGAAWDAGVRYFDTAPHYGLGLSERRLGMALSGRPRDEFIVSTKVGRALVPNPTYTGELDLDNGFAVPATLVREPAYDYDGIRRSLEESLVRLGLDRVDIIYIHDPDVYDLHPMLDLALPAVEKLRDEGLVTAVGVGSKSVEALYRGVMDANLDIIMVAGRFTLLEQPAATKLLPSCLDNGVGVVVAAPFNSGLLATNEPSRSDRYEYGDVPGDILQRAQRIAEVCRDYGVPLPAAALQYPLRHEAVVNVVVGATTSSQILQSINNMDMAIPDELWQELEEAGLAPCY
jgi:D-threo-aldose 1-dehydrogenase